MWQLEEAERFWRNVVLDRDKEIKRLMIGIDNAIYHLANENIEDVLVVEQIKKDLIELYKIGEYRKLKSNEF